MADFFQSSLCNPTAPREVLIPSKKSKKIKTTKSKPKTSDATPEPRVPLEDALPPSALTVSLRKLLDYFNNRFKLYSNLREDPSDHHVIDPGREGETGKSESSWIEEDGEVAGGRRSEKERQKEFQRHKSQNTKYRFLFMLYLYFKERNSGGAREASDRDQLVEQDLPQSPLEGRRKKRKKRTNTKKKAAHQNNALKSQKDVVLAKKKKMGKRLRKGCRDWACGVTNMSLPLLNVYSDLSFTYVSEFQCDVPYVSKATLRNF